MVSAVHVEPAPDGINGRRRYLAIAATSIATFMMVVDNSTGNVALPTIARDLGVTPAASVWIVNGYQLAIVMMLLPFAALGEIVGYRRVSIAGLAVFGLGALAATIADSLLTLSLARIVQGIGAAAVVSVSGALMRFIYPHALLGRAVAINSVVIAVSAVTGPSLASAMIALGDWRWIYGFSAGVAIAALVLGWFALPHSERSPRQLNVGSAVLNMLTFGLLLTGGQAFVSGQGSMLAVVEVIAALALGAMLVRRELSEPAPLLPLDLLRGRLYAISVITAIGCFVAQSLAFVSLPFYFQTRLGFSAVESGLLMTPWPMVVIVAAPIAGYLVDRHRTGSMTASGMAIFAFGLALLAALPVSATAVDIAWRMGVCGLGFAVFQAPNNRAVLGSVPRARSGAASGMLSMARSLGNAAGAIVAAACFKFGRDGGATTALVLAAMFALTAAGVSLFRLAEAKDGAIDSPV